MEPKKKIGIEHVCMIIFTALVMAFFFGALNLIPKDTTSRAVKVESISGTTEQPGENVVVKGVMVSNFTLVKHTETPGEQAYASTMRSVGDDVMKRIGTVVEKVDSWGDEDFWEITALGGMVRDASELEAPAGYSQLKIYFQLASGEMAQAGAMFEVGDRETAAVHLRCASNYIRLGYAVQGFE